MICRDLAGQLVPHAEVPRPPGDQIAFGHQSGHDSSRSDSLFAVVYIS